MYAVVTRGRIHDFEEGRRILRDEGIPRLRQAPGFVGGTWVRLDEENGTAMIVFESEEAARGAAEQLRSNPPAGSAVELVRVDIGEVVERV